MKDGQNIIVKEWPENYGRAWVDLLESNVSEHAKMCYVAMTSFGKESRAGNKALLRRMGLSQKSINTLRAAQSELVITGWMQQIERPTATKPAVWKMNPASSIQGADSTPPGSQQHPPQGADSIPKQEDKHEYKQEPETGAIAPPTVPTSKKPTKAQLQIAPALPWQAYFKQQWELKMKDRYSQEAGSVKEILAKQTEGFTFEQFQAKVGAYLEMDSDNYVAQERWNLMVLLRWRWNKINVTSKAKCDHTNTTWGSPYKDGTQIGKCSDCGQPLNRNIKGSPNGQ